ncbi:MAG: hypothetical protein V1846_04040 [Candidatus Komeilibacteria bacterium]
MSDESELVQASCALCEHTKQKSAFTLRLNIGGFWFYLFIAIGFAVTGTMTVLNLPAPKVPTVTSAVLIFGSLTLVPICLALNALANSRGPICYRFTTEDDRYHCHQTMPHLFLGQWHVSRDDGTLITGHIIEERANVSGRNRSRFLFKADGSQWMSYRAYGSTDEDYVVIADLTGRSLRLQIKDVLTTLNRYSSVHDLLCREGDQQREFEEERVRVDTEHTRQIRELEFNRSDERRHMYESMDWLGKAICRAIYIAETSKKKEPDRPAGRMSRVLQSVLSIRTPEEVSGWQREASTPWSEEVPAQESKPPAGSDGNPI